MLASLNAAVIQVVLGIVMFTSETQITAAAPAMPPAMRGMTAVQMQKSFVCVSAIESMHTCIIV